MMNEIQTSSNQSYNDRNPPLVYKIKQYQPATLLSSLSYMLIRPPRFLYNDQLLMIPEKYETRFTLEEYLIPFKLSLYRTEAMRYVILYLHGNSSSRFQGYMNLKQLPPRVGLACFDFNGCGMRFQSDFITLGNKQSKEVDTAASFLKNKGFIVVGWGRSMGAVSLLLSNEIDIMAADSPFCSLKEVCQESSSKFLPSACCCFVKCFFPCVYSMVRNDIQQRTGSNIDDLEVIDHIRRNLKNKDKSLFLMAGEEDAMIPVEHAKKIYEAFPGNKKISIFEGSHNSDRPFYVLKEMFQFLEKSLGIEPSEFPQRPKKIKLKELKKIPVVNKIQKMQKVEYGQNTKNSIDEFSKNQQTLTQMVPQKETPQ